MDETSLEIVRKYISLLIDHLYTLLYRRGAAQSAIEQIMGDSEIDVKCISAVFTTHRTKY